MTSDAIAAPVATGDPIQHPIRSSLEVETGQPSLTSRTIAALRERFAAFGHCPSQDHWEGLIEIAQIIEAQARGTAPAEFFYSALPTGMGKTSVVVESVRHLLADPAYSEVGVVIFVNQLDQIKRLIEEIGLERHQFAVETGKDNVELNALGRGKWTQSGKWKSEHQEAQVLFTTQQKLMQVLKFQKDFESFWQFRGQPRRVRVWDEAILPADPIVIPTQEIVAFAELLTSHGQPGAAATLRQWAETIGDSAITAVPWFLLDLTWKGLDDPLLTEGTTGTKLVCQQGCAVRVHRDVTDAGGRTTISYRESLPLNFAPLLILDASGSLRLTYKAWAEGRGGLVQLRSPGKTYRNLTIYHWDHPAGKAAYRANDTQRDLAQAVAKAFSEVPANEQLLVIVRLHEKPYADLQKRILDAIKASGGDAERVRFLTWGRHTASNAYADIRHVIVVGLLQYSAAANEAHWRAAAKTPAETDVSGDQLEALRLGEIAHHLFQGVGRGAVRKSVGGDVPMGCKLWCIFSTAGKMGIPRGLLRTVFPEAQVKSWEPFGVQLRTSKLKTDNRPSFVEMLLRRMGNGEKASFELRDLEDAFSRQMARRFLNDPEVSRALESRGIVIEAQELPERRRGGRVMVYTLRRRPPAQPASTSYKSTYDPEMGRNFRGTPNQLLPAP